MQINTKTESTELIEMAEKYLIQYEEALDEGHKWAKEFGFAEGEEKRCAEGSFHALFRAIRNFDTTNQNDVSGDSKKLLGLGGTPFYIPASSLAKAEGADKNQFCDFFHFSHLETALEEVSICFAIWQSCMAI